MEAPLLSAGRVRNPPPLSLYIHLPWCTRKCPYCDFNSHQAATQIPETEYINALLADAESLLPAIWGRRVQTIFLGGGTPSLFSPTAIDRLFSGLRALSLLPPDIEITMEANPDSSDMQKFSEFRALGINRLSLGVQSFDDSCLRILGRVHDGAAARRAATAATEFDNFNIDLMHALPGQTATAASTDVKIAIEFAPTHLSLYQLTLEPKTPFFRHPPTGLPSEDTGADIADAVARTAAENGYARYEVSAYARAETQCNHNLNYWRFGDYAGIGAGAHGKLTVHGEIWRDVRITHPATYMRQAAAGTAVAKRNKVSVREAAFEFLLNALRLTDGFETAILTDYAGVTIADIEVPLAACEADGLLERTATHIRPTTKGLRYLNDMLIRFLPTEKSVNRQHTIVLQTAK